MINLLIARHGNTFDPGDTVRRVGCGTDIPLSNSGRLQAQWLGEYLREHHPNVAAVYSSTLQRTATTAEIALKTMGSSLPIMQTNIFNEIDYGPDEGKPETEVIARLGKDAIEKWEQYNTVPNGWNVNPEAIQHAWQQFADERERDSPNQTILVVTSNGIARFAPEHAVKLKTGAISLLTIEQGQWRCIYSNRRPVDR